MNLSQASATQAEILFKLDNARPFSAHWELKQWQAELALAMAHIWCAEQDGQVVGFIATRGAADNYEITNLAVSAIQCRQGIGLALVTHAVRELKQRGAVQITLEVGCANIPAQRLYQKAGFVKMGVRKKFYKDGSDALIMGIPL